MLTDSVDNAPTIAISSLEDYARAVADFITRYPLVFGGADLMLTDFGSFKERSAALMAVLLHLADEQGNRAIQSYVLLAPPGADPTRMQATLWEVFTAALRAVTERDPASAVIDWMKRRVSIVVAADLRPRSVLELVDGLPERAALIVLDAAAYRDDAIPPFVVQGASGALREEDIWAPQLHALALEATSRVRGRPVYVAMDAGRSTPQRQELVELLRSIDGCGVFGSGDDESLSAILSRRSDVWDAWIREGRLGKALQDIDALPDRFDRTKSFLKIQLMHRAGQGHHATAAIRDQLDLDRDLDPEARVKLAKIAQDSDASALARQALEPALSELKSREALEIALDVARKWDDPATADLIADRLELRFPDSRGAKARRRRRLLAVGDYAALAAESDDPVQAAAYGTLARHLSVEGTPDYVGLIAAAGEGGEIRDAIRGEAVQDALRRGLLSNAFSLAAPPADTPRFRAARDHHLIDVMEALFLHADRAGKLLVASEDFNAALESLIRSLALRPGDGHLRVQLGRLLQPSPAGSIGLAHITVLALKLASLPIQAQPWRLPGTASAAWLTEHKAFAGALLGWLDSEQPFILGALAAPEALMTESADEAVSAVADYIQIAPLADEGDLQAFYTWLAVGAAVSPHCSDPDFDLRLLRVAAGKLASGGFAQDGRDLAERAIELGRDTPGRRRLAWFTLADALLRGRNALEGLIALACTFVAGDVCDEEQAFQEAYLLARTLRDLSMSDLALDAAVNARLIMDRMGLADAFGQRVDTLELQIRLPEHLRLDPATSKFQDFLAKVLAVGRSVLEASDQTEPVAAVLAELIRRVRAAGAPLPDGAGELLDRLIAHASGRLRDQLQAASEIAPSPDQILGTAQAVGSTRYSDDVGFDTLTAALMASRALSDDRLLAKAEDVAFALEMTADRGVATPGWDGFAPPPRPPQTLGEPLSQATALSRQGLSVIQAAWDDDGRLVRLEVADGLAPTVVREPSELICEKRFRTWAERFPYAYGVDEITTNLFYTTTEGLRLSSLPKGPVVWIGGTELQAFPPNLLRTGDDFAGRFQPMASAPSLAWLAAARSKGFRGDGRRCAWISAADASGQTLAMIADRLRPTFDAHNFAVDSTAALPSTLSGASIAVITAHGGVHPEGRFFHVVSDEGNLRVAPLDLANALRNVALVILFVCSGGRADKHPVANTTLGLAKQILDRGCCAVVASPWPLDSRVPAHWFPAFMAHWDAGASVIAANFEANAVVDRNFGLDPARGLAMTIYGDPLLSRH